VPPPRSTNPTAVQRAIEEGYKPRAATEAGIPRAVDPVEELSVPIEVSSKGPLWEVIYRLQDLKGNDVELGRAIGSSHQELVRIIGEVREDLNAHGTAWQVLGAKFDAVVSFMQKADDRAERELMAKAQRDLELKKAEYAAAVAESAEKTEKVKSNATNAEKRWTSTEKIVIAFITSLTALAGTYLVSHSDKATSTTTIQQPAPAPSATGTPSR
jgi:hypothetical protein